MKIYPAIDIIDGRCVRLMQGDYEQVSIYNENPAEIAKSFEEQKAEFLHIVDLDGARKGTAHNDEALSKILKAVSIPVQIGGGIRTMADIKSKLDMGITRVILGTAAVTNPDLTKEAVAKFGKAIAVGVDATDGKVAISGWTSVSDMDSISMIRQLKEMGVSTVIYTDISKDGMMAGANIPMYREAGQLFSDMDIIAAGGVTTIDDVRALAGTGISGAIIGKALYLDSINLQEAIEVARQNYANCK